MNPVKTPTQLRLTQDLLERADALIEVQFLSLYPCLGYHPASVLRTVVPMWYVLVFPFTCSSDRSGASQLGREAVRAGCERRTPMAWLLVLGWASLPTP
jgi:hypothetical protein